MKRSVLAFLLFLMVLAPATAHAARARRSFGPEIGFSSDPSQVVVGGHLCFGSGSSNLDFVPGVDVAFGDNFTLTALNGDFHYRFDVSGATWQPYVGAGVSLYDYGGRGGPFDDSTVGGGNLIVGADLPTDRGSSFSVEARLALGDGPSFRLMGAWNFPLR